MGCPCHACVSEDVRLNPYPSAGPFGDPRLCRMFLCQTCGNKRCPHAADHRNACTNSNASGQKGSLYEDVPASGTEAQRATTAQTGVVHDGPTGEAGDAQ